MGVLADERSPPGSIRLLPAHPHEGGIGAPEGEGVRVRRATPWSAYQKPLPMRTGTSSMSLLGRRTAGIHRLLARFVSLRLNCRSESFLPGSRRLLSADQ
jgi:hypothetical protein